MLDFRAATKRSKNMPTAQYQDLTPWESRAGNGPVLRGRRTLGRQPTIHFLSGNGFCGGVYWPMLRRFLPGHGLFLHDIEGHGDSDNPPRFSGVEPLLKRIPLVMAQQGLPGQPLIGMGHSFGAALTLRVAADNPGLFRALVLLDPIVLPAPAWAGIRLASALGRHPMAQGARRRRQAWPSRDEAFRHLRGRGIYKGWSDEALACFVDHAMRPEGGEHVLSCPRELEAQIFERPVYPWRAFGRVEVPILFLRGAQSYGFFPWAERQAQRSNPRVVVRTLPGGHCFMQEDPAAAHAAVAEFLSGI